MGDFIYNNKMLELGLILTNSKKELYIVKKDQIVYPLNNEKLKSFFVKDIIYPSDKLFWISN